MMTNRERLLAIMDGKSPDRIPWIPRMRLWWTYHLNHGTLPEKYRGWRLRDIERDLGLGTPARDGRIFRKSYRGTDVVVTLEGMDIITRYITPVGTVSSRFRRTAELDLAGIEPLQVEALVKRPEDYDVMMYLVENTQYHPCYDEYLAYEEKIGDDGYPMVAIGDAPLHWFLQIVTGYERGYYDLFDHTQKVERLLQAVAQKEREELWPIVVQSPARLFLHGVHLDSQVTPPDMFEKYITPYYQAFTQQLHRHGKVLSMHADNDSRLILKHLEAAGYDMQECFTTYPLVSCTLQEARDTWGSRMIIWGGVPSIMLEDDTCSDAEFEAYMMDVFRTIAPGDAFILGVADNVTGPSKLERVIRIGEMVAAYGTYPIQVP
jgi:uroporphyrinogen-III decarboxylase